jgi:ribosomal protein S18 acetylase RimI-like enzyme
MEGLVIRKAAAGDLDRIAEIIAGEPGREAVAIAGCEEAARDFGIALVKLPGSPQGWEHSTVAEVDGEVVGVIQTGVGLWFGPSRRLVMLAIRTFGAGLISVWPRYKARQRVEPAQPSDAWYIGELDVDPAYQNRGIGAALLEHAEAEARQLGYKKMSLQTTTINPARRLYERQGFSVMETRTDASYERMTGISGRHLMVKELS